MHTPPSVTYPVGRSRFAGLLMAALWLAGAATTVLWLQQPGSSGWRIALAVACVPACGVLALSGWLLSPRGELAWTGQEWLWLHRGSREHGAVTVHLDLQARMLLRFRGGQGKTRWLWLERSGKAGHWNDLRRAACSRAGRAPSAPQTL